MTEKFILNFAPTGMVPTKEQNPAVPIAINEIIEEVCAAYEIGITIVHLHARDHEGKPSADLSIFSRISEGISQYCPELVQCFSLSGRNTADPHLRAAPLELHPDMASLTLSSLNFVNQASINAPDTIHLLCEEMMHYGVKPELEVFDLGMMNYAHYLISKKIIQAPFYFNFMLGNIAGMQSKPDHLGLLINGLPPSSFWAVAGLGTYQLSANMMGLASGGGVRIGLEDNLYLDHAKTSLATNQKLLQRIHNIAQLSERTMMTASEFGQLGFYNKIKRQLFQTSELIGSTK
ncbi:MAG TPA: 3-keto-5-aminohexanoate cleavage protein [Saprospiraceae bacterium]|nr:3-keto-5-aminohexanoate cleavage protein [Saprospiraceae bacterium]HPN68440.1 3-keto-5-aminohexanoate cleavage protein [Saprospiraceae bacterium]